MTHQTEQKKMQVYSGNGWKNYFLEYDSLSIKKKIFFALNNFKTVY